MYQKLATKCGIGVKRIGGLIFVLTVKSQKSLLLNCLEEGRQ